MLPHLGGPRPIGALTECVPDPGGAGLYFALDELLADRGSLPDDLADRVLEPIVLCAHLGHVAQLACEIRAPLKDVPEHFLAASQCVLQVDALTGVGVLRVRIAVGARVAPRAALRLLPPAHQGDRQSVELLDALELPSGNARSCACSCSTRSPSSRSCARVAPAGARAPRVRLPAPVEARLRAPARPPAQGHPRGPRPAAARWRGPRRRARACAADAGEAIAPCRRLSLL